MKCRVLALCGGVGGAKLCLGLYRSLPPDRLAIAVNTGDDFELFGLSISPDLDTVLYTLAGLADPQRGWGREDETWHFMAAAQQLGLPGWFQLGDRDLALHVARTAALSAGKTLSSFTAEVARHVGIRARLIPMSDDRVATMVCTAQGELPFQKYFVERKCAPVVTGFRFEGAQRARPADAVIEALADPELQAVVICPSNPYLSIDPILAVPGIREALQRTHAPVVAVSPLIRGDAVKGPASKIMRELGLAPSSATIARHYAGLMNGLVIDVSDAAEASAIPVPVHVCPTMMRTLDDRQRLAQDVLAFAGRIASREKATT